MSVQSNVAVEVAECYRQAGQVLRESTLRQGNVIRLDETTADELVITADLHGNRSNFRRILEYADLASNPHRHVVFQEVCHGGTIYPEGGGCMSHLMLEDISQLILAYPEQVHFLISNHELSELIDYPIMKGGRMLNLMFRCGMNQMYGDQINMVRRAQLEFLSSLPIAIRVNDDMMVTHSLPKECDQDPFDVGVFDRELTDYDLRCGGAIHRLVWGRDFRQENVDAFAEQTGIEMFITGHEPCQMGFAAPNTRQIVLDCCNQMGKFMVVPVGEKLSQQELVDHIHWLHEPAPAASF